MAKLSQLMAYPTAQEATEGKVPLYYVVNRGRNTGGGAAFVYWRSPNGYDPTGIYYTGSVPFGQLTDIIWAETLRT